MLRIATIKLQLSNLKLKVCVLCSVFYLLSFPAVSSASIDTNMPDSIPVEASQDSTSPSKTTDENPETKPAQAETPSDSNEVVESSTVSTLTDEGISDALTNWTLKPLQISPAGNSGAAMTSIPIIVPPGRKGIEPRISLNYNSNTKNGWIGVGWGLDMGSIQRNTKRGVDYNANDYVITVNGSASELVSRGDWGTNYYGAKIEGTFSRYYKNSSTGGWEVTTKDGTKYYYGTTAASRQDSGTNVFKWCLDKVQDTNGNYLTVTYWKDQGEIYLDRIDYTGNGSLPTTNYVKFYLESRTDAPVMYTANFSVKTAYRLKTIEVRSNNATVRAYALKYDADPDTSGDQYSAATGRSLLSGVLQYGSDVTVDQNTGAVTIGSSLPEIKFTWEQAGGLSFASTSNPVSTGTINNGTNIYFGDWNGDGITDVMWYDNSSGSKELAWKNWTET